MENKIDMSVVDGLLKQEKAKVEKQKQFEEEMQSLKADANICFGSTSGKRIAKSMMKVSGIYNINKNVTDPVLMGEHRGMAKMYLVFIKGMCSQDLISDIETNREG